MGGREGSPDKHTKLCMRLGLMEGRFQRAELIYQAAERPDVGLGVIRFFLHELGGHIVGRLWRSLVSPL